MTSTEVDTEFSLHGLATSIVKNSASAEPSELAAELVASIGPEHLDQALQMMARAYMRIVIHGVRENAHRQAPAGGSRKVDAARKAWRLATMTPEYLPSLGAWIHLGDATRMQVLELANVRLEKANENAAAAKRYQRIAKHMGALKVDRVSDLPEDVLERAFTEAAKAA